MSSVQARPGDAISGHAKRMRGRRLIALMLIVFFTFSLFTVVLTWPLAAHPTRYYFSPEVPLDGEATIAGIWYWDYAHQMHWTGSYTHFYGFPFGVFLNAHTEPAFLYLLPIAALNRIAGPQAAYNILMMLSFPFAGLLMFLFVYYIIGGVAASFLAGFLYTFSAWHTARVFDHQLLTAIHCLPLFALALVFFYRRRDVVSAVTVVLAWCVALFTDIHFAFFCALLGLAWLVAWGIGSRRWKSARGVEAEGLGSNLVSRHLIISGVLIIAVCLAAVLPIVPGITRKDPNVYTGYGGRSITDATKGAARLWNYVFPPAYSLIGRTALKSFYSDQQKHSQSNEFTLYLSLTALALATVGFFLAFRRRPGSSSGNDDEEGGDEEPVGKGSSVELKTVALFALLTAVFAFVLSLPPHIYIGHTRIPTPSIIQQYIASPFRFYSRWGLVVIFAVTLMAGIGFELIRKRHGWSARKTVVVLVILLLVFCLEVSIVPPWRSKDISKPPQAVVALESSPKNQPIAIYPLVSSTEYPTSHYKYFQMDHKHPMLNGVTEATEGDLYRMALKDIYSPYTAAMLKTLGIDKAVVLSSYFSNPDFGNYPYGLSFEESRMPAGYRLEEKTGDGYVYDVVATPAQVFPLYYSNFLPPALLGDGRAWTVTLGPRSEFLLVDKGRSPYHRLSFTVNNPGEQGTLRLKLNGSYIGEVMANGGTSKLNTPWMALKDEKNILALEWSGKPVRFEGSKLRSTSDFDGYLMISDPSVEDVVAPK